jgi:hypothetical protein
LSVLTWWVGATTEIARLEAVESTQAASIEAQHVGAGRKLTVGQYSSGADTQHAKLREVELALADAQSQARRVPELEQGLAQLRLELEAARKESTDKAVEASLLAGEADALRAHDREQAYFAAGFPRASVDRPLATTSQTTVKEVHLFSHSLTIPA